MVPLNAASAPMVVSAPADAPLADCWFAGCCAIVDREGPVKIDANEATSITRVDFLIADSSMVQ